ncbi:MAG: ribosome-associated translation inhibitor RaiA [Candidatus Paceibacterota bacterium]
MNIKITSTNFDLTPAIEEYITKKMLMIDKFFKENEEVLCEVEIGKTTNRHKSGDIFKAEVNMSCEGSQFYCVVEKDDLYASIDEVKDGVERSVVSDKTKKITLFRKGSGKIKALLKRLYNRKND